MHLFNLQNYLKSLFSNHRCPGWAKENFSHLPVGLITYTNGSSVGGGLIAHPKPSTENFFIDLFMRKLPKRCLRKSTQGRFERTSEMIYADHAFVSTSQEVHPAKISSEHSPKGSLRSLRKNNPPQCDISLTGAPGIL